MRTYGSIRCRKATGVWSTPVDPTEGVVTSWAWRTPSGRDLFSTSLRYKADVQRSCLSRGRRRPSSVETPIPQWSEHPSLWSYILRDMNFLFLAGRDPRHPLAGGGDIQAWEWARYAALTGHRVTYVCMADEALPDMEEQEGIIVMRMGKGLELPLNARRFYRRYWQRFDILYEDVVGGGRFPYLSPLYAVCPVIAAWHQLTLDLLDERIPWAGRLLIGMGERLLAHIYARTFIRVPSATIGAQLTRQLGFPVERIRVIPASIPGGDIWSSAPTARDQIVLCIANFRRYKAVHHVVKAFPSVFRRVPGARLVLMGRLCDHRYFKYIHRLIMTLGLHGQVALHPNATDDEKYSLLRESAIAVVPSHREGFGIAVLEANAFGLPVVASTGVPEDAVGHCYNGLRYPYGCIGCLADAIVDLLSDEGLRLSLAQNALGFARMFTWSKVGEQFMSFVREVVHGSI